MNRLNNLKTVDENNNAIWLQEPQTKSFLAKLEKLNQKLLSEAVEIPKDNPYYKEIVSDKLTKVQQTKEIIKYVTTNEWPTEVS